MQSLQVSFDITCQKFKPNPTVGSVVIHGLLTLMTTTHAYTLTEVGFFFFTVLGFRWHTHGLS